MRQSIGIGYQDFKMVISVFILIKHNLLEI